MREQLNTTEFQAEFDKGRRDFSGVNLNGVDFKGINLSSVNLNGVDFKGINLSGIDLSNAHVEGTIIQGAILDMASFRLFSERGHRDYSHTVITNIDLRDEANLDGDLKDYNFEHAKLYNANFAGCTLTDVDLEKIDFSFTDRRGGY